MPWCDTCSKFWNPSSMTPEGACPTCGRVLDAAPAVTNLKDVRALAGKERTKVPWHFKLLVAAVAAYLGWRLWELVAWVIHQL
jgi:hypothetical protein